MLFADCSRASLTSIDFVSAATLQCSFSSEKSQSSAAKHAASHAKDFKGEEPLGIAHENAPADSHGALTAGTAAYEHGSDNFIASLDQASEHQAQGTDNVGKGAGRHQSASSASTTGGSHDNTKSGSSSSDSAGSATLTKANAPSHPAAVSSEACFRRMVLLTIVWLDGVGLVCRKSDASRTHTTDRIHDGHASHDRCGTTPLCC